MGTCFSCCRGKIMRKQSQRSTFLLTESSNEGPHDNEEFLELEQRTDGMAETQSCTSEITEITKPNKLTFKKAHFSWLRNENQLIPGSFQHRRDMKSPADSIMPLLHRESSFAETCSFTGSQKWEQLSNGATPGSSVDLEWENEIGFNSANFGATEELQWMVLTENTNNSWRSSPVSNSNGLEWDGDFTSVDISEIATETQKLTADLEDNIEQDNSEAMFRDIENNN